MSYQWVWQRGQLCPLPAMVGRGWAYCLQKDVQARPAARLDTLIQKVSTNGLSCARPGDVRDNNSFICLLIHSFNNWPLSSRPVPSGQV